MWYVLCFGWYVLFFGYVLCSGVALKDMVCAVLWVTPRQLVCRDTKAIGVWWGCTMAPCSQSCPLSVMPCVMPSLSDALR